MKNIMKTIMLIFVLALLTNTVSATLMMDDVQFDPAIIAAGDEVDIIVQYHDEIIIGEEDRIGDSEFTFAVFLESDDSLTEQYVTIQDAKGDDVNGRIFAGGFYNKKFRIKVNNNAPAGNYEFKLTGQWYKNGIVENDKQFIRFMMPVKKEGIVLDISTLETVPAEVRPGDNYVKLVSFIANVGQKDAKSVEINLELPEGFESSYTNNNRVWAGRINAGEEKEVTFFVDIDEKLAAEEYDFKYSFKYSDLDNNNYQTVKTIPFFVKERPYLEIVKSEGTGLAGRSSKLYLTIKNTGSESAEAVDVRLLKQNSQPFNLDIRSDYIGELEPGEEGLAVFDIKVNSDAEIKEHDFQVLIRSKGDSDEGDDNIYTYNRRAKFDVTGVAPNRLKTIGLFAGAIIIIGFLISKWRSKK
jgi:hypothetical protein